MTMGLLYWPILTPPSGLLFSNKPQIPIPPIAWITAPTMDASLVFCGKPGMTQNMDMTVMDQIFISKSIMNFKKWY